MLNRLPLEVECLWFESRPRIDIGIKDSKRGIVSFRGEDAGELLKQVVTGYANLLVHSEQLQEENKKLRLQKSAVSSAQNDCSTGVHP